jgi:uncharacterized protein YciU (UPF0263 family)
MQIAIEYTLNHHWITDQYGEPVAEYNFTVPGPWLADTLNRYWPDVTFEYFLDSYDPEVEGEFIYRLADRAGVLIFEEITVDPRYDVYYDKATKQVLGYDEAIEAVADNLDADDIVLGYIEAVDGGTGNILEYIPDWFRDEMIDTVIDCEFKDRFIKLEECVKKYPYLLPKI